MTIVTPVLIIIVLMLNSTLLQAKPQTLTQARENHKTELTKITHDDYKMEALKTSLFKLIQYSTELGDMNAFLSAPRDPSKKYPAIIWVTGGFPAGGVGESAWKPKPKSNDQSAKDYRTQGMVMMYPTFRGTANNPGNHEGFYGEVDDLIAAAKHLAKVAYVDPDRIYLGGHSTGATLVLLAAATGYPFKAVFALGAIDDPAGYGAGRLLYDSKDQRETKLRAPIHYLDAIKSKTYLIEGKEGNHRALMAMKTASKNNQLNFMTIEGGSHFDILAPVNRFIARDIADKDADQDVSFTNTDLQMAYDDMQGGIREVSDLKTLASLRDGGLDLNTAKLTQYYFFSRQQSQLVGMAKAASNYRFKVGTVETKVDKDNKTYYRLVLAKNTDFLTLTQVFAASRAAAELGERFGVQYDGWYVD